VLLSFRVSNHLSLRGEQQLNLAPAYEADRPPGTDWPAVPVAAIFGANASGKSNLVNALAYMVNTALNSDRTAELGYFVNRHPFRLDRTAFSEPSWYDLDIVLDGVRYTYGFGVDSTGVAEEWLHRYPSNRKQIVFERAKNRYRFGTTVGADFNKAASITPSNILFITVSARYHQPDVHPVFRWLRHASFSERGPAVPFNNIDLAEFIANENRRLRVLELLQFADFGIADIEIVNTGVSQDGTPVNILRFKMIGSGHNDFNFFDQSSGTQAFLNQVPAVLRCLETGGLMVIDELESNLHPNLAARIVSLFQHARTNPYGAQLLFTTHNTSLLGGGGGVLKRDQVWFVEKSHETGSSKVYPLSDFKPRDKENTERRYLGGSYGAVPFIDDDAAFRALSDLPASED
jgi:hypothetical protein